jgi:hypothetical protein
MNALIKSSILLLPATAIAIYLYAMAGDEGFVAVRSQPHDAICKEDGERLARLQAKPSLDEGLRFVGELRCLRLWPQLQTIVDGLSNPAGSTALTSPNRAVSDMISASDAAPTTASPASDDARMMRIDSPNSRRTRRSTRRSVSTANSNAPGCSRNCRQFWTN